MVFIVMANFTPFKSRRGQATVEFALVVPVLIVILLGIAEMGWLARNTVTLSNAAREGSRAAALGKKTADIRTRVKNYAQGAGLTIADNEITMEYSDDNGTTWTHTPTWPTDGTTYNGVGSGKLIRITVTDSHQQLTNFFPFLSGRTLTQKSIMRRETT